MRCDITASDVDILHILVNRCASYFDILRQQLLDFKGYGITYMTP